MVKYRIKTEKEFIKDFGENWRKKVTYTFPAGMDMLLGKPILLDSVYLKLSEKITDFFNIKKGEIIDEGFKLLLSRYGERRSDLEYGMISYGMVTTSKIIPTYKTKKIIHD